MANQSDLLIRVRADATQATRALSGLSGTVSRLAGSRGIGGLIGRAAVGGGGLVAGGGILAFGAAAVKASMEFNSAFADVVRTVDGADKVTGGFDAIRKGILKMSTEIPVGATELADLAAAGGQMNIPAERILDFTRTVATMGRVTKLNTQQAAESMGVLSNITGEQDFHKIGSILTALGAANTRGITDITEIGQRFALVGTQVGLTLPQILAIGTAVSDAGIEAEMGGSSLSRIFLNMQSSISAASMGMVGNIKEVRDATQRLGDLGDDIGLAQMERGELFTKRGKLKRGVKPSTLRAADLRIARLKREQDDAAADLDKLQHPGQKELEAFAQIAGMTPAAFSAGFKADPFGTFRTFIGGLQKIKASGGDPFAALDKAGVNNIRDLEVLSALMGDPSRIDKFFGIANDEANGISNTAINAFGAPANFKGGALDAGAAIKFATTAAQQTMELNKQMERTIALGDQLAPQVVAAEKATNDMLDGWLNKGAGANSLMGTMVDNMDKLVIGAAAFNLLGGSGLLGLLFRGGAAGAGALAGAGGAAAGAASGLAGAGSAVGATTLGGLGLSAIVPLLAVGGMAAVAANHKALDEWDAKVKTALANDDRLPQSLRDFFKERAAEAQTRAAENVEINLNIGSIMNDTGVKMSEVKDALGGWVKEALDKAKLGGAAPAGLGGSFGGARGTGSATAQAA